MTKKNIQVEVKLEFPDFYEEQKCRVCLHRGTLFIFSEVSNLLESIELFGGIKLSRDDTFPKYLCKSCDSLLQNAILFRKKAQETNSKLVMELKQNLALIEDVNNTPEQHNVSIKSENSNVPNNAQKGNNIINIETEISNISRIGVLNTKNEDNIKSECSNTCIDNVNTLEGSKVIIKSEENIMLKKNKDSVKSDSLNVSNSCKRKVYECASCKIEFSKIKDYYSHKKSKHSHMQCPVCQRLTTAQQYKRHLASHQTDSHIVCEVCGKLYQKGTMARHLQLHSNSLPFPCKLCPYRGRYSESLKLHLRTHTGHKPYSCETCQLSFLTKSNLSRHKLTHSKLRPHKCIECNKGFCTKRDMVIHVKTDHNGIKDFECKICGNRYGAKRVLRKHEIRVHKRDKMVPGRKPLYLQAEYKVHNL